MDLKSLFLTNYIFNPYEVELPAKYEDAIIGLNIWPKGMLEPQKRALLAKEFFDLGSTRFYTNKPTLIMHYKHRRGVLCE